MTVGDLATQIAHYEIDPTDGSYKLLAVGDDFGMFDLLDELQYQYPDHSFYVETEYDPYIRSELPSRWTINAYKTHPNKERAAFVYNSDTYKQILVVFG